MALSLFACKTEGSDEGEPDQLSINKSYAKLYSEWRGKEEYQKLKARYGDKVASSGSGSDSSESSNASVFSSDAELDFLKTLSALKGRKEEIYTEQRYFRNEEDSSTMLCEERKPRPMYLKDYERKVVLEKGGELSDSESSGEQAPSHQYDDMSYVEQQKRLKEDFLKATESSETDAGLFSLKHKSGEEKRKEEADYLKWMKSQGPGSSDKRFPELEHLKRCWEDDTRLEGGERFLRDYILNRRYKCEESTMEEDGGFQVQSSDEEELEKQESFERRYNFRFEEPDADFVKAYPRTIAASMRRKHERRKQTRDTRKARKKIEKAKVVEEIKELKNLERRKVAERLAKLKRVSGAKKAFSADLLERDFDPGEHDARMAEIFDDEHFYGNVNANEDQKPVFSSDSELSSEEMDDKAVVKNIVEQISKDSHLDSGGLSKYDYADLIGDTPCRFHYRAVPANDFGLSVNEILSTSERELNAWASLKKTCQYRDVAEEKKDIDIYRRKGGDINRKRRAFSSLDPEARGAKLEMAEAKSEVQDVKKISDPNIVSKTASTSTVKNGGVVTPFSVPSVNGSKLKLRDGVEDVELKGKATKGPVKRKSKKARLRAMRQLEKEATAASFIRQISDERLQAYGLNPKKVKNRLKYGVKHAV